MLYSPEHRFVLIKNVKTAGSSLERALGPELGPRSIATAMPEEGLAGYERMDWLPAGQALYRGVALARARRGFVRDLLADVRGRRGPIRNPFLSPQAGHMSAAEVRAQIGAETFDRCTVATVCRHPYDWAASMYYYHARLAREGVKAPVGSFREWLASGPDELFWQRRLLGDENGMLVTRVLHYETLLEDTRDLCDDLGIDGARVVERLAATRLKSDSRPRGAQGSVAELIDDESQAVLDYHFDYAFEAFGYEKVIDRVGAQDDPYGRTLTS